MSFQIEITTYDNSSNHNDDKVTFRHCQKALPENSSASSFHPALPSKASRHCHHCSRLTYDRLHSSSLSIQGNQKCEAKSLSIPHWAHFASKSKPNDLRNMKPQRLHSAKCKAPMLHHAPSRYATHLSILVTTSLQPTDPIPPVPKIEFDCRIPQLQAWAAPHLGFQRRYMLR